METLLLVITIISVATAIVAFATAQRLRRHERERSEARVATLSAAAELHGVTDGGWKQVAGEWQWVSEPQPMTEPIPSPQSLITDSEPQISSGAFFGTVQREEPSGSRMPIFAAVALIVMLGGALMFLNTSASSEDSTPIAQVGRSEPLELVALGHAREIRQLTITGTVRNPAHGLKLEGLTAVISLLDRDGTLLSTKDVPLDYRAIGPGEEAPFKVTIPDPGSIVRYRVSFRAGTDVVPHVDRRVDTKLASAVQ